MRVEDDKEILVLCRSLERFEPSEGFVGRVVARCRTEESPRHSFAWRTVGTSAVAVMVLWFLLFGLMREPAGDVSSTETALVAAFVEDHGDMVEVFLDRPDTAKAFGLFWLFYDYARSWDETMTAEAIRRNYRWMLEGLEG